MKKNKKTNPTFSGVKSSMTEVVNTIFNIGMITVSPQCYKGRKDGEEIVLVYK